MNFRPLTRSVEQTTLLMTLGLGMSLASSLGCQRLPVSQHQAATMPPRSIAKSGWTLPWNAKPSAISQPSSEFARTSPREVSLNPSTPGPVVPASHQQSFQQHSSQQSMVQPAQHLHVHGTRCACGGHGDGVYRPILSSLQEEMGQTHSSSENCVPLQSMAQCLDENCQACVGCPRGYDPQEYLFDGGDHAPRVIVQNDGNVVGLQPEDTVVAYEVSDGKICVQPACRAAIYAPRFAAVRKVSSTEQSDCAVAAKAALNPTSAGLITDKLPSPVIRQPIRPGYEENVKLIEAFRDRNRGVPVERVLPVQLVSDAFKPYEDLQLIKSGVSVETDRIKLRKGVEAALHWGTVEQVHVLIDGQEAHLQQSVKGAQETFVYELNGKPRMRICKVASQQLASPGDEIHFTIRVDNVGEQEVLKATILDSLTPRLEFIEGSQQSSLEFDFEKGENEVGSSILRWTMKKGLKPGQGGYIRFRCKVR